MIEDESMIKEIEHLRNLQVFIANKKRKFFEKNLNRLP